MCGGPRTQAEYMERVNNTDSRYQLLGTYYNQAGQKAIMVTDGDEPEMEYIYNIYSTDGHDYRLTIATEDRTARELAVARMTARGFTYTEDPLAKPKRAARPKRPIRGAPVVSLTIDEATEPAPINIEATITPRDVAELIDAERVAV